MIEWHDNGDWSVDEQWVITTEKLGHEPVWLQFSKAPDAVREYVLDHPGDINAWTGRYSASTKEMQAQAERLLAIVAKASKKRGKK